MPGLGGGLLPGGVPGLVGGVLVPGRRGEGASQRALRQNPVNRMTDRCKNITFATSLRTVKM